MSQTQSKTSLSNSNFLNLHICDNPVIQNMVTQIRDKNTSVPIFRENVKKISHYITYEASIDIKGEEILIDTPLEQTKGIVINERNIVFIPILRAGLGMLEGALNIFPNATVYHVGLYRDEETLEPVEYYVKIPEKAFNKTHMLFILDPMLATGGSAVSTVDILKNKGACNIKFLSIISAPEGVKNLNENHSDVSIYTASLDRQLNDKGYILPGLGDAGDRIYGT